MRAVSYPGGDMGSDMGSDYAGMSMGSGSGGYAGMGGSYGRSSANQYESPYDATVEIYGLIYIYNPVDPVKLGLEDEEVAATDARAGGCGSRHAGRDGAK